jgi:hypothetical protein
MASRARAETLAALASVARVLDAKQSREYAAWKSGALLRGEPTEVLARTRAMAARLGWTEERVTDHQPGTDEAKTVTFAVSPMVALTVRFEGPYRQLAEVVHVRPGDPPGEPSGEPSGEPPSDPPSEPPSELRLMYTADADGNVAIGVVRCRRDEPHSREDALRAAPFEPGEDWAARLAEDVLSMAVRKYKIFTLPLRAPAAGAAADPFDLCAECNVAECNSPNL